MKMDDRDKFKDYLKQEFDDFETSIPVNGWKELSDSLNVINRRRTIQRWSSIAAIFVLLLAGSLYLILRQPAINEETMLSDNRIESIKKVEEMSELPATEKIIAKVISKQERVPVKSHRAIITLNKKDDLGEKVEQSTLFVQNDNISSSLSVNNISDNMPNNVEDKQSEISEEERQRQIEEFRLSGEKDILLLSNEVPKEKKGITLALNGSGGFTSSRGTTNAPVAIQSSDMPVHFSNEKLSMSMVKANAVSEVPKPRNIVEMEHAQPVSFGLIVSKELFTDFSLETGIVYTYLSSRERNSGLIYNSNASRNFHYLGVPLNVNYRFFSIGDLDFYGSIGGKVEKDVLGESRYDDEIIDGETSSSSTVTIIEKIKQENPQFSLNAGIGLSYPIYNDLKLYGKIGSAYYFDAKNTYNTIYSDKQISVDLNVGIRYDF